MYVLGHGGQGVSSETKVCRHRIPIPLRGPMRHSREPRPAQKRVVVLDLMVGGTRMTTQSPEPAQKRVVVLDLMVGGTALTTQYSHM